jgi:hypothetical protein
VTPEQFVIDFITSFTEEILRSDGDPAPIVDKYYTPDIVQTVNRLGLGPARIHPACENRCARRAFHQDRPQADPHPTRGRPRVQSIGNRA